METREELEWLNVKWYQGTETGKRVLFVGDSITLGYSDDVHKELADTCLCAHLCTSKSIDNPSLLQEIAYVMQEYPVSLIHFNNGLHGWHLTSSEYGKALEKVVLWLRKSYPQVLLMLATSTRSRRSTQETEEIQRRNLEVTRIASAYSLPLDNLCQVSMQWEDQMTDGVHYTKEGYAHLAHAVAIAVRSTLPFSG